MANPVVPMRLRSILLAAIALAASGCLGSPGTSPAGESPDASAADAVPDDAGTDPAEDGNGAAARTDRPHVHDYWYGASRVTLLDENVPVMLYHNHLLDEPPREQHTHGCDETLASSSQGGSRKFSLPPGQIVLPGTEALELAVSWDAPAITGLRLRFRTAAAHDYEDAGAVANGGVAVVSIDWREADPGHATRSRWGFFLCADGATPVDLAQGDVHVRIDARRAKSLPLEPAHPDRWRGAAAIEIARASWTGEAVSATSKGPEAWRQVPFLDGAIVPADAAAVRVRVHANSTGPLASLDPGDVLLYYRDASQPEWVYRTANATGSVAGGHLVFEIPVDHDMTDGEYATESAWDLWLRVASRVREDTPVGRHAAPHHFAGDLAAVAMAERDVADPA